MIENMFSTFTNMLSSITKEFNIFAICIIAVLFIYYICPKIFKIFNKIFKKRKDKESALFSYIFQDKLKKQEGKESAYAIGWWICIFGFGFGLYFLSFMQAPRAEAQELWSHILSAVITSIRASIKMFSFDFDYADVRRIADNSISYLVVISICFLSASLWTIFVVMNLFFKGIMNEIKLTFIAKNIFQLFRSIKMTFIAKYIFRLFRWKNNNYHYIIVGCEKSMRTFLDDLQKEKISKFDITIITGIPIEKGDTSTYSKEFIKEGYTVINGKVDEAALERAGINNVKYRTRVIAITECDKQNLNVAGIITQKIFTNIFSEELKELKNKYKKNEDKRKQEEIKFLDEMVKSLSISTKSDEEYNKLSSEKKTEYDETQKNKQKIIDSLKNINLEAHIMYSFIERTEHFAFAENAYGKVDFFNPYELRARRFFGEHPITSLIPHSFIDTNKARLKEKYNVKHIFVGFGNANYQMLKGSIQTCQLLNCDYNATIYDENINNAPVPSVNQAMFMNHSSGLFDGDQTSSETEYFRSPEEKYDINFKNGNVLTKNFYTGAENCLIKEMENDFTIIYVALGDDKLNIETACEIRQCLYKNDITKDNVRIFVKISEKSVFNEDLVINNPQNIPIKIECFGFNDSVFTKDNIINESLDEFAKKVTNKNHEIRWEFLSETKRDINRQVAMAIRVKLNLLGLDLTEQEESKNEIDGKTYYDIYYGDYKENGDNKISKIINLSKEVAELNNEIELLVDKAKIENKKQEIKKKKDERSSYILDYEEKNNNGEIKDTPRNNLARLEHLRWNTFYLIHGWTKMSKNNVIGASNSDRQNGLKKQHACITTFEGLIELRKLQAQKMHEKGSISIEEAEAKVDTIWYDYSLMDELPVRLRISDRVLIH